MKFRPFAEAKDHVHSLGLQSEKEWRKYCKSGKKPVDIPYNAYRTYEKEWISWGDWLGTGRIADQQRTFRPFAEAKDHVHSLGLQGEADWREYCNTRDNNGGGIYWAGICSKLDFFIIEPCENLVTNNGYDLTDKGKRIAACIAGGGLLTVLDPSMQTLLAAQPLGKAVGCSTLLSEL